MLVHIPYLSLQSRIVCWNLVSDCVTDSKSLTYMSFFFFKKPKSPNVADHCEFEVSFESIWNGDAETAIRIGIGLFVTLL